MEGVVHGAASGFASRSWVGEGNAFEAHALRGARQTNAAGAIRFGWKVQKEEDAARRGDRFLQFDPVGAKVRRRHGDAGEDEHQRREIPYRHRAVDDAIGHQHSDVNGADAERAIGDGRGHEHDRQTETLAPERLAAAHGEPIPFLLAGAKALHRRDIAHGLFHRVRGRRPGGALVLVGAAQRSGERKRDEKSHRHRKPGDPHQFRHHIAIRILHDVKADDGAEQHEERLQRELVDEPRQQRHVVQHAVNAVADALVVQCRHRQPAEAPKEACAQAVRQALRQPHMHQELEQAPHAAALAVAGAELVFGLRGGVVSLQECGTPRT